MSSQIDNINLKIKYIETIETALLNGKISLQDLKDAGVKGSQAYFLRLNGSHEFLGLSFTFRKTYPNTLTNNLSLRDKLNEHLDRLQIAITQAGATKKDRKTVTENNRSLRIDNGKLRKRLEKLTSQFVLVTSELDRTKRDLAHYKARAEELEQQLGAASNNVLKLL